MGWVKIQLKPIKVNYSEWDVAEKRIKKLFKDEIYLPLLKLLNLPPKTLKNAYPDYKDLTHALFMGTVTYSDGSFKGQFNAGITKDLKRFGAKFDKATGTFKVLESALPLEIKNAVSASIAHFNQKVAAIDAHLAAFSSSAMVEKLNINDVFSSAIWKTDKAFRENVKKITIEPKLSESQVQTIAKDWGENMKLDIKKWTDENVKKLRVQMKELVFKGVRVDEAAKMIQANYGVSARKAKFLARQETNLLLAKYKETRYQAAGIDDYIWKTVHMPVNKAPPAPQVPGYVRYSHGLLNNTEQKFSNPPNTANPGEPARYNNPKCDYNCRCESLPVAKFKK